MCCKIGNHCCSSICQLIHHYGVLAMSPATAGWDGFCGKGLTIYNIYTHTYMKDIEQGRKEGWEGGREGRKEGRRGRKEGRGKERREEGKKKDTFN